MHGRLDAGLGGDAGLMVVLLLLGVACLAGSVAANALARRWWWRYQVRRGERLLARALRR